MQTAHSSVYPCEWNRLKCCTVPAAILEKTPQDSEVSGQLHCLHNVQHEIDNILYIMFPKEHVSQQWYLAG